MISCTYLLTWPSQRPPARFNRHIVDPRVNTSRSPRGLQKRHDLVAPGVVPRLRATGLPCIANPEIMSSGNTQHLGTEIIGLLKLEEA